MSFFCCIKLETFCCDGEGDQMYFCVNVYSWNFFGTNNGIFIVKISSMERTKKEF